MDEGVEFFRGDPGIPVVSAVIGMAVRLGDSLNRSEDSGHFWDYDFRRISVDYGPRVVRVFTFRGRPTNSARIGLAANGNVTSELRNYNFESYVRLARHRSL